jgi:hypothetical protein
MLLLTFAHVFLLSSFLVKKNISLKPSLNEQQQQLPK